MPERFCVTPRPEQVEVGSVFCNDSFIFCLHDTDMEMLASCKGRV